MILTETEINKISGGSVDYFDRIVFARAVESALLENLRAGVEAPEPAGWMNKNGDVFSKKEVVGFNTSTMKPLCTVEAATQYGAAQRLAGRERAIEECAAECLVLHANGNYKHDTREDCYDAIRALAASPQEQI